MLHKIETATIPHEPHSTLTALLVCPECHGDLSAGDSDLACEICSRSYPLSDGLPLLARTGPSLPCAEATDDTTSLAYQERFLESNVGPRYQQSYQRRWSKRRVTRREILRIKQLLATQARCRTMLDLPCGGGRVSEPLVAATDGLLQADLSLSQVQTARQVMSNSHPSIAWFTASAFLIPLRDGAVDGVLCNRLTHHLPAAELEQVLTELLRVASRFVIVSYYDHDSFKSWGRRLRGQNPGHTLRRHELHALAERLGAFVQKDVPLWFVGSRLRYAILRKCPI